MTDAVVADIAVLIECPGWASALTDLAALAEHAARAALDGAVEDGVVFDGPVEFSLVLADDARVQALNARWRGQDKPTNVLSFAARDADDPPMPPGEPEPLGDIIIAFETTSREAAEQDKRLSDHLCHLIVHGVLHLLGYDHLDDAEAEEMEALERIVLADLGVPDPYADAGTPGLVPVDGQ